jgi:anti-sigma B factor antagonist
LVEAVEVTDNQIHIIHLKDIFDAATVDEFEKVINYLITRNFYKIIVDLTHVEFISSAGWGAFTGELRRVRENQGDIKLVGMNPDVFDVFLLLELDSFITAYDTVEEAIAAFTVIAPAAPVVSSPIVDELRAARSEKFREEITRQTAETSRAPRMESHSAPKSPPAEKDFKIDPTEEQVDAFDTALPLAARDSDETEAYSETTSDPAMAELDEPMAPQAASDTADSEFFEADEPSAVQASETNPSFAPDSFEMEQKLSGDAEESALMDDNFLDDREQALSYANERGEAALTESEVSETVDDDEQVMPHLLEVDASASEDAGIPESFAVEERPSFHSAGTEIPLSIDEVISKALTSDEKPLFRSTGQEEQLPTLSEMEAEESEAAALEEPAASVEATSNFPGRTADSENDGDDHASSTAPAFSERTTAASKPSAFVNRHDDDEYDDDFETQDIRDPWLIDEIDTLPEEDEMAEADSDNGLFSTEMPESLPEASEFDPEAMPDEFVEEGMAFDASSSGQEDLTAPLVSESPDYYADSADDETTALGGMPDDETGSNDGAINAEAKEAAEDRASFLSPSPPETGYDEEMPIAGDSMSVDADMRKPGSTEASAANADGAPAASIAITFSDPGEAMPATLQRRRRASPRLQANGNLLQIIREIVFAHPHYGPTMIRKFLESRVEPPVAVSRSTVYRYLREANLNTRQKRLEFAGPGQREALAGQATPAG